MNRAQIAGRLVDDGCLRALKRVHYRIPEVDPVATAQFAIDSKVEQRPVAQPPVLVEPEANRPNPLLFKGALGVQQSSLVHKRKLIRPITRQSCADPGHLENGGASSEADVSAGLSEFFRQRSSQRSVSNFDKNMPSRVDQFPQCGQKGVDFINSVIVAKPDANEAAHIGQT